MRARSSAARRPNACVSKSRRTGNASARRAAVVKTPGGKFFAGCYALYGGLVFIVSAGMSRRGARLHPR
jgi:hypothetical protein